MTAEDDFTAVRDLVNARLIRPFLWEPPPLFGQELATGIDDMLRNLGITTDLPPLPPPKPFTLRQLADLVASLDPPPEKPMRCRMSTADLDALRAGTLEVDPETPAWLKRYAAFPAGLSSGLRDLFGIPIAIDEDCERPVIEPIPERDDTEAEHG